MKKTKNTRNAGWEKNKGYPPTQFTAIDIRKYEEAIVAEADDLITLRHEEKRLEGLENQIRHELSRIKNLINKFTLNS